ncbi:MAG: TonB-dependent receptor [Desulfobacterales bacterium]|nr:TonB-dependent receptor [Desulfobacterales bacterium]
MKQPKTVTILIVSLISLLMLSLKTWAADAVSEPEAYQYELEEIVVTATRLEAPKQEVAANITVITRDDIEKMPASNAAEVLQYVPGVYVEFNGGLGSQATATIQGSDVRHVAVYQDGVPLNQLANPMADLSYLPIDTIERIEIYKGAASSAWGSSLGGVINIITKEPDPKKPFAADVRTSYGEFKTLKSRGTLSGTVGRLGYLLSLTHVESDGFIDHTEYEQDAVYGKINYELGKTSRVNFVYSYDEGSNADPVLNDLEILGEHFWDDLDRKRTYERLLFETSPVENLNLTIEGRHHRFYNRIDDVFSDHTEIFNDYKDETWGVSARISYDTNDLNRLAIGFDEDWGRYEFINYAKDYETRNWATYANDTFTVGDFSFNAGIRYDDNDYFGSEVSPSGGVVYRFAGVDALIRGQVAKGFSAPPAAWVQDPQYGNKDLKPEIGINYQLGGEVRPFKFLRLELNLFRSDIEDLIRENPTTWKPENIDKVTRQGVEGNIRATFDSGLILSFGGSFIDVKDEETDEVIENIPRVLYNVSVSYTHEWMTHSLVGKYIYHNSSYPETHDQVFVFDYLFKAKLPFPDRYGKLNLFGAVYNLTNASYIYREVFPQPDRWIEGGVSFEF